MSKKNVTSVWLADRVGISKVAISNIITGKSSPSLDNLLKIADALGVTIQSLLANEAVMPQEELTALIQHRGDFYKATTIAELEKVVSEIKEKREKV